MDALLAALDDSPDALLRVRTLLQQDGTLANGLDGSGTSALMHASAAGLAECVAVLLSCSADPRLRRASDGATALTLAAASCKPASICAPLQHARCGQVANGGRAETEPRRAEAVAARDAATRAQEKVEDSRRREKREREETAPTP